MRTTLWCALALLWTALVAGAPPAGAYVPETSPLGGGPSQHRDREHHHGVRHGGLDLALQLDRCLEVLGHRHQHVVEDSADLVFPFPTVTQVLTPAFVDAASSR